MVRDFTALSETKFDLAVIGGGINGAATAREAALRGLKVALIEARDFACGTSSRSSKLIHGGLRYLEQLDFKLVREARLERRRLLKLAPHLARPIPFLLPIYRGDPYSALKIRAGLWIYDILGNLGSGDRHRMLSVREALRSIPALRTEGLRAAAVYHDSETDDARLTLENVLDASDHGAVVLNYTEIRALVTSRKPEVVAAEAVDTLTGRSHEISARFWVNATGPWVDHVRALLPGFDGTRTIRLTKGTHIIVPPVSGPFALFAAILPGDRIFVMAPWNDYALMGTTDTDFEGDPASVQPAQSEVDYLLGALNRILQVPIKQDEVVGSFAGLRALAMEPGKDPSANTREYRFHCDPQAQNFVSICGGKLTTARALGENLIDLILRRPGLDMHATKTSRPTRTTPLPGGQTGVFDVYLDYAAWEAVRKFDVPYETAARIVRTYGSRWRAVLDRIKQDTRLAHPLPGTPPLLAAEVEFSIREEMAMTVEDFLLRRSGQSWLAAWKLREAAPGVADIFAARFGWNASRKQAEIDSFSHQALVAAEHPEGLKN